MKLTISLVAGFAIGLFLGWIGFQLAERPGGFFASSTMLASLIGSLLLSALIYSVLRGSR